MSKKSNFLKKAISKFKKNHPVVAVVRLSGIISTGSFMGKTGLNLDDIEKDLEKAFETFGAKAVALEVNSPGGSPVQSEFIAKRIMDLSAEHKIPVYTFVEEVAASGGYWLACAGEVIYASKSSIVGSIGVVSSGFGYVEAIKKLGVERRVYHQGENKAILDPFQKENPKDVEILMNLQKDVHDYFKDYVRERRKGKIKKADEKRLFSGEFWNGVQGHKLGLVDEIGELRSVMREKYGKNVRFEKITKPKGWLKRKLGAVADSTVRSAVNVLEEKAIWSRYGM